MQEPIQIEYNGKTYWGFKSPCPIWLKKKLINAVGYCEDCRVKENLEVHRPKRGIDGGLYMAVPKNHPLSNSKILCHNCHNKYNYSKKLPPFTIKRIKIFK